MSDSYQYQGCGHFTGASDPESVAGIIHGYCWRCRRCRNDARDLQNIAISLLPAAIAEQQNDGHYLLESVVGRAIYAAQMMQEKCLKAVAE